MTQDSTTLRVKKIMNEFNIGIQTINDFLRKKGLIKEDLNPNAKIEQEWYAMLMKEFQGEKQIKQQSMKATLAMEKKEIVAETEKLEEKTEAPRKISADKEREVQHDIKPQESLKKDVVREKAEPKTEKQTTPVKKTEEKKPAIDEKKEADNTAEAKKKDSEVIKAERVELTGPKVIDKIDIEFAKPKQKKKDKVEDKPQIEAEEKVIKDEKPEVVDRIEDKDIQPDKVQITEREETAEIVEITEEAEFLESEPSVPDDMIETQYEKLSGPTIVGKIDLAQFDKKTEKPDKKDKEKEKEKAKAGKVPVASSHDDKVKKRKRKRIEKGTEGAKQKERSGEKARPVVEVSDEEIQKQIKETLARLTSSGKSKASKYRRQKRDIIQQHQQAEMEEIEKQKNVLKVTEFLTANDLASMMNIHVNQVISTCLNLGLFVSINQRLGAEVITLVADEFGYDVEFVSEDSDDDLNEVEENQEGLLSRHPVVTVMGHVDHGKTSLLDFIRKSNVIAGEAGGITQHIGAYEVTQSDGKKITFLDTPGHEAFTAMRARGAKLTDIAIIVIAADDRVMPQTVEAINHARAANVPMVFAINKIDKPNANPEKIKEELSQMNILVEDWGGKFQSQEISAKQGVNVDLLLEKVLLEAELLELKANPDKFAAGAVIESSLEKGRGYVSKILIQSGTLKMGDIAVAGCFHGRVRAMFNERNQPVTEAGPSTPVLLLGLDGAPQAGDRFNVYETEREAKQVCVKRQQLLREQGLRTQKHITLDEIGRRIAIGDFKELNIIVKGDVDGSIEALSDSLLKQSTSQVQVNVIHKSVGQITESDVLLASASDAIIVGFQVRPSVSARKLAENEQIDIRTYSVIYDAIEEIRAAIEGMLAPTLEEKIVGNIEVRDVFKITKVGTVAGCMVLDGKVSRNTRIRIIRDGIVIYEGTLSSLKRFKDDVKEVSAGYECGLSVDNYNDLKIGDIIEGFEIIEKKAKL